MADAKPKKGGIKEGQYVWVKDAAIAGEALYTKGLIKSIDDKGKVSRMNAFTEPHGSLAFRRARVALMQRALPLCHCACPSSSPPSLAPRPPLR